MPSKMELEFEDYDVNNKWNSIYMNIKNESSKKNFQVKEAKKNENKGLNRYKDVIPYDHSRVILNRSETNYINASLTQVPTADRAYILTQGPLGVTTGHFWLMIWEQKTKAILMLNRIMESGRIKCHQYWPNGKDNDDTDELTLFDVSLKVQFISETKYQHYIYRKLLLIDLESDQSREVFHFHYTSWPDFGLPESPSSFLQYLFAVRQSGSLDSDYGPPVVHCSAGIGRSGTFCLVDSCLVLIEKYGSVDGVNVIDILLDMRKYRMGLIQTHEQLRFSYQAILEGSKLLNLRQRDDVPSDNDNIQPNESPHSPKILRSLGVVDDHPLIGENGKEDPNLKLCSPPPKKQRLSQSSTDVDPDISTNTMTNARVNSSSSVQSSSNDLISPSVLENNTFEDETNNCSNTKETTEALKRENQELRSRMRNEKKLKTEEMISRIKRKQKESETRSPSSSQSRSRHKRNNTNKKNR